MDGGLGGGNGFMFRTRTEDDAKAFVRERQGGKGQRHAGPVGIGLVAAIVLVLVVLGVLDWLG